jgi:hypothetical protein
MINFEVLDPCGATEVTNLHAARLHTLEGKTVAFLTNDMWQAHRMLPMVRELISEQVDNVTFLDEYQFPVGNTLIDTEETVDMVIAAAADAVVLGNAA